jgi:acyl-CoA reductase-like NAD-dependent aldehyde dehydrogenase
MRGECYEGAGGKLQRCVRFATISCHPAAALVMREETFGPVLPVTRARDAGHAVALANANPYGLGAAVFADRGAGPIARALPAGSVSVNSMKLRHGRAPRA